MEAMTMTVVARNEIFPERQDSILARCMSEVCYSLFASSGRYPVEDWGTYDESGGREKIAWSDKGNHGFSSRKNHGRCNNEGTIARTNQSESLLPDAGFSASARCTNASAFDLAPTTFVGNQASELGLWKPKVTKP